MAIKRGSKVDKTFSAASMTDLMFLLLIFLLVATTLINPNAIKLTLPKGSNKVKEKAYTSVSITADLKYYVERDAVTFNELEGVLKQKLAGKEDPVISLHCDQSVPFGEVIKFYEIALKNNFKIMAAIRPK